MIRIHPRFDVAVLLQLLRNLHLDRHLRADGDGPQESAGEGNGHTAVPRKIAPEDFGDDAKQEDAVNDGLAEARLLGVRRIDVNRVVVARHLGERPHVIGGDKARE